ncbi:hypothetical protein KUTeg_023818 [Tegillarca granosa]|uniref:Cytochrome P450 n=1 Tax=Tegillarca granosa TaxID=220873 RepID=A0ABQ9E8W7_TEGGR|nr:hypothetical protein KUTeg_023818 [Tegillarca granosa]
MDVLYVLTSLLLTLALIVYLKRKKRQNPPPGPAGYPFIGNTFDVDVLRLHLTLTKWAEIYGDIYEVNLFGSTVIVLNSPELIRNAFLTEPNASLFSGRILDSLTFELFHECKDIAFGTYNEPWIKRRKLGHKILKAYGEGMREIEKSVTEELRYVVSKLENYVGKSFDPEVFINDFLNQIVSILLTGRRHDVSSANAFLKTMETYDKRVNDVLDPSVLYLINWLPFMRYIPSKVSRLYHETKQSQKAFEEQIRQEQKMKLSNGMIRALYDELERLRKTDADSDWLTEESIFAILTNMIAGGILTSKGTMLTAIRILLERKDIQRRIQSEVDQVVGPQRPPTLLDRKNMPYTEAFLLEVMRYGTNLALAVPHCLMDDTNLAGYDLKKGSMVLMNLWKIHHDDFLNFGIGKRSCLGEAFARSRMFLFISTIMQHFTFEPETESIAKFDPRDMKPTAVRMPQSYKCRVEKRILTLLVTLKRKKRRNPPPGPTGYPVVGNTFGVDGSRIHLKLTHWAEIYGDIYEVNLFGSTVVVLNSPELIRKAFLTEPNATLFSGRVDGSLAHEMLYQAKDIAFGAYSESWIKRRKLGHKILRAYGAGMKEIEKSVTEELTYVTSKLESYNGRPFDPEVVLNDFLNQIIAILGTLLIAIRILLERKDVQRKLQSEVDRVVGFNRPPSLTDRKHMSYLEAFLLEVLRYGTNLPISVPHKLMEDTTLEGYDLLKDSWSIFPDPYEFKPERFLDKNGVLLQGDTPDRQKLLSFGVGKRSCIGESFARNRMFLFLATMMQHFTFEPEAENIAKFDPRDMQTTVVRFPHHFKCRVERRLKQ